MVKCMCELESSATNNKQSKLESCTPLILLISFLSAFTVCILLHFQSDVAKAIAKIDNSICAVLNDVVKLSKSFGNGSSASASSDKKVCVRFTTP